MHVQLCLQVSPGGKKEAFTLLLAQVRGPSVVAWVQYFCCLQHPGWSHTSNNVSLTQIVLGELTNVFFNTLTSSVTWVLMVTGEKKKWISLNIGGNSINTPVCVFLLDS